MRWLQQLAVLPGVPEVPAFSGEANALLDDLANNFDVADAQEVKEVRVTAHTEACLCLQVDNAMRLVRRQDVSGHAALVCNPAADVPLMRRLSG